MENDAPSAFWLDRPTLVTGGTGLVGSWLVRQLLDAGADIVCLVRDWVPQSELVRTGLIAQVKVVRGDVEDQALLERALGEYEIDTIFHLAAQTIVGIANRNPVSTFETNIAGTWAVLEAARRSPKVKQVILASSDKAYGDQEQLPYDETTPLGYTPNVSKSALTNPRRMTISLPVADPLRLLRRRRSQRNRIVPGASLCCAGGGRAHPLDGDLAAILCVEDGAAFMLRSGESRCSEAFNYSNGNQLTCGSGESSGIHGFRVAARRAERHRRNSPPVSPAQLSSRAGLSLFTRRGATG
jgi:CDP-glucose 4,6-dehydratase